MHVNNWNFLATNIYGHKYPFNYKHIFILMYDNRTLIIVDEFHKAFLHDVFIPTFQRDVDGYYMECT